MTTEGLDNPVVAQPSKGVQTAFEKVWQAHRAEVATRREQSSVTPESESAMEEADVPTKRFKRKPSTSPKISARAEEEETVAAGLT